MFNDNSTTTAIQNYDNHSELIASKLKTVAICLVANIAISIFALFASSLSMFTNIASYLVMAYMGITLRALAPINKRYSNASAFYSLTAVLSIISALFEIDIFSMVISVCSIGAIFHELKGHAEITARKDPRLSRQWSILAIIEVAVVIASLVIGMLLVILLAAVMSSSDSMLGATTLATLLVAIVTLIATIVLTVARIVNLIRTIRLYQN